MSVTKFSAVVLIPAESEFGHGMNINSVFGANIQSTTYKVLLHTKYYIAQRLLLFDTSLAHLCP